MRLFNPVTMTEVLKGIHDTAGAVELPDNHWFFTSNRIPEGMVLATNEAGEPVLMTITESEKPAS